MDDPGVVKVDDGAAAYRGFLFADLRGYTAFGESRGDRAAADLLDAYRAVVREEVARHAGAEIRTEGDSFYVVFASARDAVACGLAIIGAAERYSREHEDAPLRIGIGINAGETVQRGQAFVGTAVNLAARVCSEARAGEVLVTAMVREAARGGSDHRFVPRGSKRFKGIADPLPVFAATASTPIERRGPLRTSLRAMPSVRWLAIPIVIIGLASAVIAAQLGWLEVGASPESAPLSSSGTPVAGAIESATAQATGSDDSTAFPTESESALLSQIDPEIAAGCERADPDDRPRLNVDRVLAGAGGTGLGRLPIPVSAGLACSINSSSAPSQLHYWATSAFLDFDAVGLAEAMIASDVGSFQIPRGDCASEWPAYGPWEFGTTGGMLLCRTVFGDAVLKWTYDGLPILAEAVRRDGDADRLLDWWRDEARFLRSD